MLLRSLNLLMRVCVGAPPPLGERGVEPLYRPTIRASSLGPATAYASRQYAGYVPGSQTHATPSGAVQT